MNEPVVFITRQPDSYVQLRGRLASVGYRLEGFPYIKTTQIAVPRVPDGVDWLFFMSPASVKHFFDQGHPIPAGTRIGTLGPGTAAVLPEGIKVDFVGSQSDTNEVGKDFARALGGDRVAFVRGNRSLGLLQQNVALNQRQPLICYETSLSMETTDYKPEVVVFSSPSNAEGFFRTNQWEKGMKAVAFGSTTALALQNLGAQPVFIAEATDEKSITEAIFKALDV